MNVNNLKQFLIDNPEKTKAVLENIGIHTISDRGKEFRGALPDKTNSTAMRINKETLFFNIYSSDLAEKGDIFKLVGILLDVNFFNALKFIHQALNISMEQSDLDSINKGFFNPFSLLTKYKKNEYEYADIIFYEDTVLNKPYYVKAPFEKLLLEEYISNDIQKEFNIMYSMKHNRYLFPHRYHENGKIIGIKGRTNIDEFKLLGIPKYFPIIRYKTSSNLYGLWENKQYIKNADEVIVYEAEKSVLKSCTYGFRNCVSIGGSEISKEQLQLLLELNVNIILALDNDVAYEKLLSLQNKFKYLRPCSLLVDKNGKLGEKDSPVDKGYREFVKIYNLSKGES